MASTRICSIPGCGKPHASRGWCQAHYLRWKKYRNPLVGGDILQYTKGGICSVEDCDRPHDARGFCHIHYNRWKRHGNPLLGRTCEGEPHRYLTEVVYSHIGDECLLWPYAKSTAGYGQVSIEGKMLYVHRLVCERKEGPPPTPKHEAAHLCGNGHLSCCNQKHLTWKTRGDNASDMIVHGTHSRGERCGSAKLTRDQVLLIRELCEQFSCSDVASKLGIPYGTVYGIHKRHRWAWLD